MPPAELEALLLTNEHVADAAVCGIQDQYEELPRAYIALKEPSKGKVSEKEIQDWVAGQVARHKRLDGGVKVSADSFTGHLPFTNTSKFIDEVPKSASGKIQRVIMREWAKKDAQQLKARL